MTQADPSTPLSDAHADTRGATLGGAQRAALALAILTTGFCGMLAEYAVSTLVAYLVGNSVAAFSVIIATFMCAMGLGGFASQQVDADELAAFLKIELALSVITAAAAPFIVQAMALGLEWEAALLCSALIGALIGFEIPLLMRVNDRHRVVLKRNVAVVFAADYLGSFIAGLTFSTFLLPTLGVVYVPLLGGVLNLLVACAVLWSFRDLLGARKTRLAVWAVAAMLTQAMLGFGAQEVVFYAEQRAYEDPIIYRAQTPYQRIILTRSGLDDANTCLYLNGHTQLCLSDEHRYHEALVHPAFGLRPDAQRVLILGGGDGMTLREVLKHPDVDHVTLVDLDPDLVDVARSHPALARANAYAFEDPRLTLVHADALTHLRVAPPATFDLIFIDLPDPSTPETAKLYSRAFYRAARRRLSPYGVLVTQATSPIHARAAFVTIHNTIHDAQMSAVPYRINVPSFGDWGFVLAMRRQDATTSRILARLRDHHPPDHLHTRFLNNDALRASLLWEKGVWDDRDRFPPSRLARPSVLHHYQDAWQDD